MIACKREMLHQNKEEIKFDDKEKKRWDNTLFLIFFKAYNDYKK